MKCARPFAFLRGSARGLVCMGIAAILKKEKVRASQGAIVGTRAVCALQIPLFQPTTDRAPLRQAIFSQSFPSPHAFLLGECGVAALLKD